MPCAWYPNRQIETAGRVHVFIVRTIGGLAEASGVGSGGIQPWLLAIKAVVGPVLAAKWEWSEVGPSRYTYRGVSLMSLSSCPDQSESE
jgi:hypothetical protein